MNEKEKREEDEGGDEKVLFKFRKNIFLSKKEEGKNSKPGNNNFLKM